MEIAQKICRLCLSDTEFNISLHSVHCRKTNMIDKILVCLKIVIEDSDSVNTICYNCAGNVEKYYDFIMSVRKCQTKLNRDRNEPSKKLEAQSQIKKRVTTVVSEQSFDCTFSFLEFPEEKKEPIPASSPFFSYFSPPKKQFNEPKWKAPRSTQEVSKKEDRKVRKPSQSCDTDYSFSFLELPKEKKPVPVSSPFFSYFSPPNKQFNEPQWKVGRPTQDVIKKEDGKVRKFRHNSRDLFESQSQEAEEPEQISLDWKLTSDDKILKKLKADCFSRLPF